MSKKLFTVEESFYISGRVGIVVVSNNKSNLPNIKIKDEIVLVKPDGTKIFTDISGIEMPITVSGVRKIAVWIKNVTKEDVPIGTEIFLKI